MFKNALAFKVIPSTTFPKPKNSTTKPLEWKFPRRKKAWHAVGTYSYIPNPTTNPLRLTRLNFLVAKIDDAVDKLAELAVSFESYEGEMKTDKKRIFRGKSRGEAPNIAWFKDPAGNTISVTGNR
jgi:hypothetical protein